ncbi:MAG: hypothetical protein LBF69_06985 [Prevotellaceae bacterium]|jgi:hypothetical protein|nr:hypothetical protein [Prevotellaceae bacterium]
MRTTKFIKFFFMAGCVALAAACSDEFPEREASPAGNENSMQVYFPATANKVYRELEIAENTVTVYVSREKADEAVEIPLTVLRNDKNIFDIPATISFAQGETDIEVGIPISGGEIATEYTFEIKIEGDAYVNPYKTINGVAHLRTTIVKLQWEPFASGTFTSGFVKDVLNGQDVFNIVLYKALSVNKYRFFDLYANDFNFNFDWKDGEKNITIAPTDVKVSTAAGDVYYGQWIGYSYKEIPGSLIYAYTITDPKVTYYEAEKDGQGNVSKEKFVIHGLFGVALNGVYQGGFGEFDEIFEFTGRKE